ncbi:ribosomal protein L3 glutamine methyltransferase [Litorivivens lipolytica]|uniref:Ribosomal protein uL3 glutamine methyltransferase n=1 Tax=Litorivivens lipolytica TaxID=1524264 RepID=A0A7W4W2E0_9GAMM|nr:50S ribosomal protein L3 N(5)-glutamine methyltransferase [Litorivivens lipolytica]MBB3046134.1 ribosomal protein L3 glutamine methyltransferase [Litorivivens lipolytica]
MNWELETVRDYLRWTISRFGEADLFYGHGTDNAQDDAWYLICGALKLPFDLDGRLLDGRLTGEEKTRVEQLVERRIQERIPVAYLVGEAWFAGLPFWVDERVLVPRSPLGELIEAGFQPWLGDVEPKRILDLCTGSGCIGIACAFAFPEADVVLSDLSPDALEVANSNIARHDVKARVRAIESNVFDNLAEQRFDLIVSNPPYVDAEDLASMPAEYHAEPPLGLGSGEDGLDITRRILREAAGHLNDGGLLVVEVGNSGRALDEAFPELPLTWVEFEQGGHGVFVISKEDLPAV